MTLFEQPLERCDAYFTSLLYHTCPHEGMLAVSALAVGVLAVSVRFSITRLCLERGQT